MTSKSTFVTPKTARSENSIKVGSVTKMASKTPECFKPISLGTPITITPNINSSNRKKHSGNMKDSSTIIDESVYEKLNEENTSITVAVRVRPLLSSEVTEPKTRVAVSVDGNSITVEHGESRASISSCTFSFDHCFWSLDENHPQFADQNGVFQTIACQLLHNAFEGYNTCLFAYGQTGSGKSYSIMGLPTDEGIIPRFGRELFDRINSNVDKLEKWCVEISFFEIYNEKIHDLLVSNPESSKKAAMKVREHPILGPYVEDLATFVVSGYEDFSNWLSIGNKQRATAATGMNEKSSRSHSALTIVISRTKTEFIDGKPREDNRKSKINIVDLAGSERVGANVGQFENRVKEGVSINKSLLTLGKVISQLAEMSTSNKKVFVPYRESVLTWLLKESLGGNSKTTMLATVSPSIFHVEETLSTLRYAGKAKNIVNIARVNEDPNIRLIKELKAEIEKLRKQYNLVAQDDNSILGEKCRESEALLRQVTKTKEEKVNQAKKCQEEEAELLQKSGISFHVDETVPRLINLNPDPQLSEILNYGLREGETCVGSLNISHEKAIQLQGSFIEERHCTILNKQGVVYVVPFKEAQTYVNGHQISDKTRLFHGDRVVVGGQHYFRFINPLQKQKNDDCFDFVAAQAEFLKIQNEAIKEKLTKERQKVRHEMLEEIENIKKEHELSMIYQRHDFETEIGKLNFALEEKSHELEEAHKCKNESNFQDNELAKVFSDDSIYEKVDLELKDTDLIKQIEEIFSGYDNDNIDLTPLEIGFYQLSIMIEEANRISKKLEMNLEFYRQDWLGDNLCFENRIKVKDLIENKKVDWKISKFSEKLEIMRGLDSYKKMEFFDANEIWEENEDCPVSFSPKIVESFQAAYESADISIDLAEVQSSPNSSKHLRSGLMWNKVQSRLKESNSSSKSLPLNVINESCAEYSASLLKCFQKIMNSKTYEQEFEYLINSFSQLFKILKNLEPKNSKAVEFNLCLNNLLAVILITATKIVTFFSLRAQNSGTNNISAKFKEEVEKLCQSIVVFSQSPNNFHKESEQIDLTDFLNTLYCCCSMAGKIVASLGVCLTENVLIEENLEKYFVDGIFCVTFSALQTAISELEDLHLHLNINLENDTASDTFAQSKNDSTLNDWLKILGALQKWAENFKNVHEEIINSSASRLNAGLASSHSQRIILNFSRLLENVSSICESFSKFLDEEKNIQGIVNVNRLLDSMQKNLNALMFTSCDACIQEPKESGKPNGKNQQKGLKSDLDVVQGMITNLKQNISKSMACKSILKKSPECLNRHDQKSGKSKIRSKDSFFEAIANSLSPVLSVGSLESVSQSSTSVWTTKSTITESPNVDHSEWGDFTIRI